MAKATKPVSFNIESGVTVPSRQKDIPDYGIPFEKMKKGDSLLLPFDQIPLEHSRVLVQRFARTGVKDKDGNAVPQDMPTRTEKDESGKAIGLRVWRAS